MPEREKFWEKYLALGGKQDLPAKAVPCDVGNFGEKSPSCDIAFVDGFCTFTAAADRIVCLPLDQASRSYAIFLQNRLTRALQSETDPWALLNGACQGQGVFLYIPPKVEVSLCIEHRFLQEKMASPRVICYLGREARLTFVERMHPPFFCNAYLDAVLDEGAHLILKGPRFAHCGSLYQSIRAQLKRHSRFSAHLYSEGARASRTSVKVQLLEEGSELLLQGLVRLDEKKQQHIHTLVEHIAPNTRSHQHFKSVLKGDSRSHFEGKIHVHPTAQKTEAFQLNNTLLLSDSALCTSQPNLEIFADDVKASHGATVAKLEGEDLFYLRSRGLSTEEARGFLIEGFCRELSECLS